MTDKTGGAAFPVAYSNEDFIQEGATLRDYFAAKCMQGDWSAQQEENGFFSHECTDEHLEKFAAFYYRMADAMLKARG